MADNKLRERQYSRKDLILVLRYNKNPSRDMIERAALMLERDSIQIHDLELKIMGLKAAAAESGKTVSGFQTENEKMKEGKKDEE